MTVSPHQSRCPQQLDFNKLSCVCLRLVKESELSLLSAMYKWLSSPRNIPFGLLESGEKECLWEGNETHFLLLIKTLNVPKVSTKNYPHYQYIPLQVFAGSAENCKAIRWTLKLDLGCIGLRQLPLMSIFSYGRE